VGGLVRKIKVAEFLEHLTASEFESRYLKN